MKRWVGPQVDGHAPPPGTNPATYYYHDGWNLVQEGGSANNAERLYVHGGRVDEIVASQAGGVWNHHHYDARGHCLMLTDTNGAIREQYDYDAFGMPYFYNAAGVKLGASSQWGNRFLFTGREWLQELRIYDLRNRIYQPELGRFLQPDPKQFEAGDYNLYRYCHNDPINKTDPFGLDTTVVWVNEGDRNQHEPVVVRNGKEYIALTEPELYVTVSEAAANGDVVATVHYVVNVHYSDDVGPHNKEVQKKEPDHGNELDKWRDERGKPATDKLSRPNGPLQGKSPKQVKEMVDRRIRGSFNQAVAESRKKHDVPGDHRINHPLGRHH